MSDPGQYACQFHDGFIVFPAGIIEPLRKDGHSVVDVEMQGQGLTLELKIPVIRFRVILLPGEPDLELVGKDVGHAVEQIHPTVFSDHGFRASQVVSEGRRQGLLIICQTRIVRAFGTLPP